MHLGIVLEAVYIVLQTCIAHDLATAFVLHPLYQLRPTKFAAADQRDVPILTR